MNDDVLAGALHDYGKAIATLSFTQVAALKISSESGRTEILAPATEKLKQTSSRLATVLLELVNEHS